MLKKKGDADFRGVCHSAQEAQSACVPWPVPADLWAIFLPQLQQLLSVVSLEPPDNHCLLLSVTPPRQW